MVEKHSPVDKLLDPDSLAKESMMYLDQTEEDFQELCVRGLLNRQSIIKAAGRVNVGLDKTIDLSFESDVFPEAP